MEYNYILEFGIDLTYDIYDEYGDNSYTDADDLRDELADAEAQFYKKLIKNLSRLNFIEVDGADDSCIYFTTNHPITEVERDTIIAAAEKAHVLVEDKVELEFNTTRPWDWEPDFEYKKYNYMIEMYVVEGTSEITLLGNSQDDVDESLTEINSVNRKSLQESYSALEIKKNQLLANGWTEEEINDLPNALYDRYYVDVDILPDKIRITDRHHGENMAYFKHYSGLGRFAFEVEDSDDYDESLTEDALDDQGVSWVGADVLADRAPSRVFVYNNRKLRGEDLTDYFGNDILCLSGNRIVNRKQANESLTEAANDYPTDPNKLKARLREINKAIERGEDPEYFAYEKKKIFDQLDSLGSNYYDESLTDQSGRRNLKEATKELSDEELCDAVAKVAKEIVKGVRTGTGKPWCNLDQLLKALDEQGIYADWSDIDYIMQYWDCGLDSTDVKGVQIFFPHGFGDKLDIEYISKELGLDESLKESVDSSEFGGELTYVSDEELLSKFDTLYTEYENELDSKLNITLEGKPFGRYSRAWKTATIPVDDKRTIKVSLTYSLPDGIYNYIYIMWTAELTTKSGAGNLYGINYSSSSRTEEIGSGSHGAYKDGSREKDEKLTIDELVNIIKSKYLNESLNEAADTEDGHEQTDERMLLAVDELTGWEFVHYPYANPSKPPYLHPYMVSKGNGEYLAFSPKISWSEAWDEWRKVKADARRESTGSDSGSENNGAGNEKIREIISRCIPKDTKYYTFDFEIDDEEINLHCTGTEEASSLAEDSCEKIDLKVIDKMEAWVKKIDKLLPDLNASLDLGTDWFSGMSVGGESGPFTYGGFTYTIDTGFNESLTEGAEGRREPGFEYVIYDYTDEDEGYCPIVAKRSTAVEAEYLAMRWMNNDYITNSRPHPKYKDRDLTFEKVPKGKFKVGDNFYGPFDADYNKVESLNEAKGDTYVRVTIDGKGFFLEGDKIYKELFNSDDYQEQVDGNEINEILSKLEYELPYPEISDNRIIFAYKDSAFTDETREELQRLKDILSSYGHKLEITNIFPAEIKYEDDFQIGYLPESFEQLGLPKDGTKESLTEAQFSRANSNDDVRLVKSSYDHFTNDLGEIPSPDDILYDIIDNYNQDIFQDGGPYLEGKEIEAIKYILRSQGLEYRGEFEDSLNEASVKSFVERDVLNKIRKYEMHNLSDGIDAVYVDSARRVDKVGTSSGEEPHDIIKATVAYVTNGNEECVNKMYKVYDSGEVKEISDKRSKQR